MDQTWGRPDVQCNLSIATEVVAHPGSNWNSPAPLKNCISTGPNPPLRLMIFAAPVQSCRSSGGKRLTEAQQAAIVMGQSAYAYGTYNWAERQTQLIPATCSLHSIFVNVIFFEEGTLSLWWKGTWKVLILVGPWCMPMNHEAQSIKSVVRAKIVTIATPTRSRHQTHQAIHECPVTQCLNGFTVSPFMVGHTSEGESKRVVLHFLGGLAL